MTTCGFAVSLTFDLSTSKYDQFIFVCTPAPNSK